MHTILNYDTVWSIEDVDPNKRYAMKSQIVEVNHPIILEHSGTAHYLASDLIEYRNDFGTEYEVSVRSYGTLNKSQSLALERTGKLTREMPTKFQQDENVWSFVTSQDPSTDFDPNAEHLIDPAEVVAEIKYKLLQRGAFGLRGLAHVFNRMDRNGNHKLEPHEFADALNEYGLCSDKKMLNFLFSICDKNRDGVIDYKEFLRFLRGEMNEVRKGVVASAYAKLDKNKDGRVTLDDIAATYSASLHPDVLSGKKKPEDIYREFMKHWDTQVADGIVTLDEFTDYYYDLSTLIDSDEYFVVMVKNAWKL